MYHINILRNQEGVLLMEIKKLKAEFLDKFQESKNINAYFAPGRVNLIGGHVDYHGGFVLPCAINYGTYLVMSKREDNLLYGYSLNFKDVGMLKGSLSDLSKKSSDDWFSYVKGIIKTLDQQGYKIDKGFNILLNGNIPNGAGLSSSASLEIVLLTGLNDLFDLNMTRKEMVILAQQVENDYIGVNCGIMDQYAIAFGKDNQSILLNCEDVSHEYVPLKLKNNKIVIVNSNKQRKLSDSKYNERRFESNKGLEIILKAAGKGFINELNNSDYENYKHLIDSEVYRKRAKHVISENTRTMKAHDALIKDDLKSFGDYISASHHSLSEDYEVSCEELDFIVDFMQAHTGVLGSRMTGAGFGGCTVSLVDEDNIENIQRTLTKKYLNKFGYKPSFYIADVGDGSNKIELEK